MGAIDIARRHVTNKEHADIGMRIADYPTIQVSRKRKYQLNNHPSSQSINQSISQVTDELSYRLINQTIKSANETGRKITFAANHCYSVER